jgi:hypothetical protein
MTSTLLVRRFLYPSHRRQRLETDLQAGDIGEGIHFGLAFAFDFLCQLEQLITHGRHHLAGCVDFEH